MKKHKSGMDMYELRRIRSGKTARERARGAASRTRQHQSARAEYTQWCSSSQSSNVSAQTAWSKFPWSSCNGKRTRALKRRSGRMA